MALTSVYNLNDANEFAGFVSDRQLHCFRHPKQEPAIGWLVILAIMLHAGIVITTVLLMFILSFLGWNINKFDRPLNQGLEFQLVNTPEAPPRKPTKIQANRNTRSGGQRTTKRIATNMTAGNKATGKPKMGNKTQQATKATPAKQPSKQPSKQPQRQSQPRPVAPRPRPSQSSSPSSAPTPAQQAPAPKAPRPRITQSSNNNNSSVTAPKPSSTSLKPNIVGAIPVPSGGGGNSGPKNTGPIVGTGGSGKAASGGGSGKPGSSGGGASGGPSFVSGSFSGTPGGGSPGAGRSNGSGGTPGARGNGPGNQRGGAGGGGGPAGVDAQRSIDWGPYQRELEARIKRNWTPPAEYGSRKILMAFKIAKDGRLISATITRSSGSPTADAAALNAVNRAAPFMPLPREYNQSSVRVDFTFDQATSGANGNVR